MITIKNKAAIQKMRYAGQVLTQLLDEISLLIKPGVSTLSLDEWLDTALRKHGLVSQSKGYKGYRHVSCISLNDEVVHGIPSKAKILRAGDVVKIDVCAAWRGYCADMARSYVVGATSSEVNKFLDIAWQALNIGIANAKPGNRISDISASIQQVVEKHGYGVVRDFAGHGIGKHMHEDPEILNYGKPGNGPVLRPGMTLAIEPMITMGKYEVKVMDDGWTVKTVDKSLAAHVEDTIVITEDGAEILTRKMEQGGVISGA